MASYFTSDAAEYEGDVEDPELLRRDEAIRRIQEQQRQQDEAGDFPGEVRRPLPSFDPNRDDGERRVPLPNFDPNRDDGERRVLLPNFDPHPDAGGPPIAGPPIAGPQNQPQQNPVAGLMAVAGVPVVQGQYDAAGRPLSPKAPPANQVPPQQRLLGLLRQFGGRVANMPPAVRAEAEGLWRQINAPAPGGGGMGLQGTGLPNPNAPTPMQVNALQQVNAHTAWLHAAIDSAHIPTREKFQAHMRVEYDRGGMLHQAFLREQQFGQQQRALSQAELFRMNRMKSAAAELDQAVAEGRLSPEEAAGLKFELDHGINIYERRQKAAAAQAHTEMMQQQMTQLKMQNDYQQGLMNGNAAKRMELFKSREIPPDPATGRPGGFISFNGDFVPYPAPRGEQFSLDDRRFEMEMKHWESQHGAWLRHHQAYDVAIQKRMAELRDNPKFFDADWETLFKEAQKSIGMPPPGAEPQMPVHPNNRRVAPHAFGQPPIVPPGPNDGPPWPGAGPGGQPPGAPDNPGAGPGNNFTPGEADDPRLSAPVRAQLRVWDNLAWRLKDVPMDDEAKESWFENIKLAKEVVRTYGPNPADMPADVREAYEAFLEQASRLPTPEGHTAPAPRTPAPMKLPKAPALVDPRDRLRQLQEQFRQSPSTMSPKARKEMEDLEDRMSRPQAQRPFDGSKPDTQTPAQTDQLRAWQQFRDRVNSTALLNADQKKSFHANIDEAVRMLAKFGSVENMRKLSPKQAEHYMQILKVLTDFYRQAEPKSPTNPFPGVNVAPNVIYPGG